MNDARRPFARKSFGELVVGDPTGGLFYHLAALRYRKSHWRPFLSRVDEWLTSWNPREKTLVVFGPSAGWTLPKSFLARFDRIVAVEPDPLARFLFARRIGRSARIEFCSRTDLLPWLRADVSGEPLAEFLRETGPAAVLFSNLLGQVPLLLAPETFEARKKKASESFARALAGRNWASYHDLVSSEREPEPSPLDRGFDSDIETLAGEIFPAGAEISDHETAWISKGCRAELAKWRLRPGAWHVIAFVTAAGLKEKRDPLPRDNDRTPRA